MHKRAGHAYKHIPGWNEVCGEIHDQARDAFQLWRLNGKPRFGPLCDIMRSTRSQFKNALRQCKKVTTGKNADSLAKKLLHRDNKNFWK